jgi:hypothetical protein
VRPADVILSFPSFRLFIELSRADLQTRLQLVPAVAAVSALPSVDHLCEHAVRRPGELHERLVLDAETLLRAETASRRAALPLGLTVVLLVEAALVRADVAMIASTELESALDRAAASPRVRRALSAAEADYLRALRGSGFARTMPTLPMRVFGRAATIDIASALRDDAARAARWEAAALLEGRTMLEWALMTASTQG